MDSLWHPWLWTPAGCTGACCTRPWGPPQNTGSGLSAQRASTGGTSPVEAGKRVFSGQLMYCSWFLFLIWDELYQACQSFSNFVVLQWHKVPLLQWHKVPPFKVNLQSSFDWGRRNLSQREYACYSLHIYFCSFSHRAASRYKKGKKGDGHYPDCPTKTSLHLKQFVSHSCLVQPISVLNKTKKTTT